MLLRIFFGNSKYDFTIDYICFNPQAPLAQKIADEVIFRRFQGEGVEFS